MVRDPVLADMYDADAERFALDAEQTEDPIMAGYLRNAAAALLALADEMRGYSE